MPDFPLFSSRPRWRRVALLAVLLAPLLWPLHHLAESHYSAKLTEQNRQTLDLYVANLQAEGAQEASHLLKRLQEQTGADTIYLMDRQGLTLAASNWDQQDSFVGRNFAFRPYFREAMDGHLGRFFGLGNTSGKRGYYFASALYDGSQALGVLVVKINLDHTETLWGKTPERLVVTDGQGVVILTSHPDWRFRTTRAQTEQEQAAIAFNLPYATRELQALTLDPRVWLTQQRTLEEIDWTVSIYSPASLIDGPVRSVLGVGGLVLLAVLSLFGLWLQRQRHYLERIELSSKAQRDLELRVQERTRALETLNSRLKQEVLEREHAQQELVRAQDELVQAGKLSASATNSTSRWRRFAATPTTPGCCSNTSAPPRCTTTCSRSVR